MTLEKMKSEMERIQREIDLNKQRIVQLGDQKRNVMSEYLSSNGADLLGKQILFDPSNDGKFEISRSQVAVITNAVYANDKEGVKFQLTRLKQDGTLYSQPYAGLHPASSIYTFKIEQAAL